MNNWYELEWYDEEKEIWISWHNFKAEYLTKIRKLYKDIKQSYDEDGTKFRIVKHTFEVIEEF